MVGFVDNQELKPVAELAHPPPAAFKGGHSDRLDLVLAVAQPAGRKPRALVDGARPLVEQHAGGHQAKGRHTQPGDGRNRQPRLARSSGQHGHAPPVSHSPRGERRFLVGTQISRPEGRQIVRRPGHLVLEPDATLTKFSEKARVKTCWTA